jgi:predicted nucleic acid-binding protein
MLTRSLHTGTQVLQELYVTLTRRGKSPVLPESALRYIDQIAAWPVANTDFKLVRRAIELSIDSMLSFWDALIVVGAECSGAKTLYRGPSMPAAGHWVCDRQSISSREEVKERFSRFAG